MASELTFKEIATLLNYSRSTRIELDPELESPGNWALYSGEYRVHASRTRFEVLYLYARAPKEELERAASEAFEPGVTQVVYAPSLDAPRHSPAHKELFQARSLGFWNTRDYLASFIQEELARYNRKLQDLAPPFFIDPLIRVPTGVRRLRPNPVFSFLFDPDIGLGKDKGILALLLASPGQGKTYMSEYLVSRLAKTEQAFPIYVNAEQWRTMSVEDLASLSKTIVNSFRYFESTIAWLEGHEEEFLRTTLMAGLFQIVFDGFDEYILVNRGQVLPGDALQALAILAETTNSRILITSRTSFWNLDVESEVDLARIANVLRYELLPFDENHAGNYFLKRFADETGRQNWALTLYKNLRLENDELMGRGFILSLIADLISRLEEYDSLPDEDASLAWLMEQLCEREVIRQQLPLNGSLQLRAIRLFVVEVAEGGRRDSSTLELSLEMAAAEGMVDLDDKKRKECLRKMASHPLISQAPGTGLWHISQDQVRFVLLAQYILDLIEAEQRPLLDRFMQKVSVSEASAHDLASMVVNLAFGGRARESGERIMRKVAVMLLGLDSSQGYLALDSRGRRLAVEMSLLAVEKLSGKGSTHTERTNLLLSFLPGGRLFGLPLSGTLGSHNFSDLEFEECLFDHVTWASCDFSETTRFRECKFIGGAVRNCKNFGSAQIIGGSRDGESAAWINAIRVNDGRQEYTSDDLRSEIKSLVDKFVGKGGFGTKTLRERNLSTGVLAVSRHKGDIIEELKRTIIEAHHISGVDENGYNVRDDAKGAIQFYAKNNVFTGPLQASFERLKRKIFQ
jgi:hypothetical protein